MQPTPEEPEILSLERVQDELRAKISELRNEKNPKRIPVILKELQSLRIQVISLREITNNITDPNAYKEFNLFNRMVNGSDLDEPEKQQSDEKEQELKQAEERVVARGGSRDSASRIVRVLQSVMNDRDKYGSESDSGEPESISKPH